MDTKYIKYYNVLGLKKHATKEEIKRAYKKLAKIYHPDTNQDSLNGCSKFIEIHEAYEFLMEDFDDNNYKLSFTNEMLNEYDEVTKVCRKYGFNGNLNMEIPYDEGKVHGIVKTYYTTGEIYSKISYVYGIKHGLAQTFYKNGKLKNEVFYINDKQEGIRKNFYKTGNIKEEIMCQNDIAEGFSKNFYENGVLKAEAYCHNGRPEGYVRNYYPSGELKSDGNFKDGKIEGIIKKYYKNGKIKVESSYKNNILEGITKNYYENGVLKAEGFYKDGQAEGEHITYDKQGCIKIKEFYKNGKIIKVEHYKNGCLITINENQNDISNISISLQKFYQLIDFMKATPIYSEEELTKLWQQDKDREKKIIERMLQENITYGEASGEYEFLNKNEKEFKAYLKIINNELDTNVEIIKHGFENYIHRGDAPLPYYAWRIAIILSKNKLYQEERIFLHEWSRHFARLENCGGRYKSLIERARKKGAF